VGKELGNQVLCKNVTSADDASSCADDVGCLYQLSSMRGKLSCNSFTSNRGGKTPNSEQNTSVFTLTRTTIRAVGTSVMRE